MDKNHAIIEAKTGVNHSGDPAMAKVLVSVAPAISMRRYEVVGKCAKRSFNENDMIEL